MVCEACEVVRRTGCITLPSHGGDQTKTSFLIFNHILEKGWRGASLPKHLTPFIGMLKTFSQIPERKDHSGLTTAGFSGTETLYGETDYVSEELALLDNSSWYWQKNHHLS